MRLPDDLLALTNDQHGIVTRQQCLAGGLSRSTICTLLKNGSWQQRHAGVYAITSGLISDEAQVSAAVLAVGDSAVVANQTAIWLGRRSTPLVPPIHIAVPVDSAARQPRGVKLHRLERLVARGSDPPRMCVERALLEVTQLSESAEQVVGLVCDAVGRRETTTSRILEELARRPRQRWRQLLLPMLRDVGLGAQSPLELADLRNDRAHGLPVGSRQVSRKSGGKGRWCDVVISPPGRGDLTLVKELDGRLGHEGTGRFRDMSRDNSSTVSLARSLRFGWVDLSVSACEAAALQGLLWQRLGEKLGHACRRAECDWSNRVERLGDLHPLLATPLTATPLSFAAATRP